MPAPHSNFRLVEDPLGPDALEKPSSAEWLAFCAAAFRQPVPGYTEVRRRPPPVRR